MDGRIAQLSSIKELPTLPEIVMQAQQLLASDKGDAQGLAKIIEQDISLASRILKLANSSFYFLGGRQRISSVSAAITRIGFNEVTNLVLAMSLIKKFSQNSNIFNYREFWRHSLVAAYLNESFALLCAQAQPQLDRQVLFLSGLFHDIGLLIFDQFFHDDFQNILSYACKNEESFLAAEKAVVGKETHAFIGSALLEIWKLDPRIVASVRFHHIPLQAPLSQQPVIYSAYLTEYILCNSSVGTFEGSIQNMIPQVCSILQIPPNAFENFFTMAESQVAKSEMILAFGTGSELVEFKMI